MIYLLLQAALLSMLAVLVAEAVLSAMLPAMDPYEEGPRHPRPTLAFGIMMGMAMMSTVGHSENTSGMSGGSWLFGAFLAALPLYAAGLRTDFKRPSSERHLLGLTLSSIVLFLTGYGIPWLGIPGFGDVLMSPITSLIVTLCWVFVVVSIIEMASLLPLAAGVFGLLVSLACLIPGMARETWTGVALSGILAGALAGRGIGGIIFSQGRRLEKAEVLVMALCCTAITLSTFLKSITLTGIILPLGLAAVFVIAVSLHGFERGIILRKKPR